MASQEIRAELDQLQRDKGIIQAQIDNAKRTAAAEKIYADRDWLQRKENAVRTIGRKIAKLQVELGSAVKAERRQEGESFERTFMAVAKEILPSGTYQEIMKQTSERTS
jgi:hypothetical protein